MRTVITKCYLVQIVDEDGNELECSYVFGDKENAKQAGRDMKESLIQAKCKEKDLEHE